MTDINKLGVEAVKALKALNAAKAAKKSETAKATELIEERNETARPLLQQVHDAIAAGQSVNGQSTWDGWAKQAGWSKRALNYILNGRKPQTGNSSSRSSFLKRIAEAKEKLADFQSRIDAPFAPGEIRDRAFDAQVDPNPVIQPLFEEFLKLLTPDHCEVMHIGGKSWYVQAYGEEPVESTDEEPLLHKPASMDSNVSRCGLPLEGLHFTFNRPTCPDCRKRKKKDAQPVEPVLTHARASSRRTVCEKNYINRPLIKNKVFANHWAAATCPDCQMIIKQGDERRKAFDQETEKLYAKKEQPVEAAKPIKVKLTNAQRREAGVELAPLSNAKKLTYNASTVTFDAATYQEVAKELILALEQRITGYHDAHRDWRNHQNVRYLSNLLDWTNRSPEAIAAKKVVSDYKGAVKALEGAIRAVVAGDLNDDDDPTRHISEWYEGEHAEEVERRAEEVYQKRIAELDAKRDDQLAQLSESAKALASKESAIVTHRWGGVTAGGGQNTRMRDYALCGARFSGSSWTTKQRHVCAGKDETPTCPKCLKLIAEQVSEPAQALAAAIDAAPVPQYDREAYAKAETVGQKRCILGSPENLKWHADLEYRRNNPVVDPNADDEFAGERD
jgi:hypothetical protein